MNEAQKKKHDVCIGLGSNLGNRIASLRKAKNALMPYIDITATSHVYETTCAFITQQPFFLNATIRGTTNLDPMGLLYTVRDLEFELGRTPTFHFGPRVIDIDILFYDQEKRQTPELTLPHVGLHERVFVLKPMAEVAPEWKHPIFNKTIEELLHALPESEEAKLIESL